MRRGRARYLACEHVSDTPTRVEPLSNVMWIEEIVGVACAGTVAIARWLRAADCGAGVVADTIYSNSSGQIGSESRAVHRSQSVSSSCMSWLLRGLPDSAGTCGAALGAVSLGRSSIDVISCGLVPLPLAIACGDEDTFGWSGIEDMTELMNESSSFLRPSTKLSRPRDMKRELGEATGWPPAASVAFSGRWCSVVGASIVGV
mmetsp:Transcript_34257/g.77634  ORF Transcript_34257/g.77634 Transcript_34257/m.77634 type:complete len:203 (-) Transcript_34257:865-1473(-)